MINWTSGEKLSLHEEPKDSVQRKIQLTSHRWEKISANHIADEGLLSRLCEEFLNSTLTKSSNRKWAKDIKGHFTEKGMWMAKKHMEKCSTSLTIREMQV